MSADADRGVLAILDAAQRSGGIAFVPTVCLVESLTGRQRGRRTEPRAEGARIVPLDEVDARRAAERRAVVDGDDAADPVVVVTAARLGAVVVTTDASDIGELAAAVSPAVAVVDPRS